MWSPSPNKRCLVTYPLAPQGVFLTVQGEGQFLGQPMVFVRLAGCDVGCPQCDTDYTVRSKATASEIVRQCVEVAGGVKWVWITGGEPTIHDIAPLIAELRRYGFRIALATAGMRPVVRGWANQIEDGQTVATAGVDFLSVSPHILDAKWVCRRGDQVNLVAGLNGLRLESAAGMDFGGFSYRYVTPCDGRPETLRECVDWVLAHPEWRLGVQAHKLWGLL